MASLASCSAKLSAMMRRALRATMQSNARRGPGGCRPPWTAALDLFGRYDEVIAAYHQAIWWRSREDRDAIFWRFHVLQLSRRRLIDLYFRAVVVVADHHLQRPVPPSRHIRLGEDDLGDRADHIPLSGGLHLPDHATSRDGRAAEPAGPAGARRYAPFCRL